ncbi:protein furry [Anaeramoeba ignava]|uniref:Protein furry n=1 Tax=Anaeramoeba ignava TaxID=1746090 RepID=A0A9Q0LUJ7_ANAIG|nr:protein furry [Anaeramoeba ignava]
MIHKRPKSALPRKVILRLYKLFPEFTIIPLVYPFMLKYWNDWKKVDFPDTFNNIDEDDWIYELTLQRSQLINSQMQYAQFNYDNSDFTNTEIDCVLMVINDIVLFDIKPLLPYLHIVINHSLLRIGMHALLYSFFHMRSVLMFLEGIISSLVLYSFPQGSKEFLRNAELIKKFIFEFQNSHASDLSPKINFQIEDTSLNLANFISVVDKSTENKTQDKAQNLFSFFSKASFKSKERKISIFDFYSLVKECLVSASPEIAERCGEYALKWGLFCVDPLYSFVSLTLYNAFNLPLDSNIFEKLIDFSQFHLNKFIKVSTSLKNARSSRFLTTPKLAPKPSARFLMMKQDQENIVIKPLEYLSNFLDSIFYILENINSENTKEFYIEIFWVVVALLQFQNPSGTKIYQKAVFLLDKILHDNFFKKMIEQDLLKYDEPKEDDDTKVKVFTLNSFFFKFSQNWKNPFEGLQPLLLKGLTLDSTRKKTLSILFFLNFSTCDHLVDKSETRYMTAIILLLTRIHYISTKFHKWTKEKQARIRLEIQKILAKLSKTLSSQKQLSQILLQFSTEFQKEFFDVEPYIPLVCNQIISIFFPQFAKKASDLFYILISSSKSHLAPSFFEILFHLLDKRTSKDYQEKFNDIFHIAISFIDSANHNYSAKLLNIPINFSLSRRDQFRQRIQMNVLEHKYLEIWTHSANDCKDALGRILHVIHLVNNEEILLEPPNIHSETSILSQELQQKGEEISNENPEPLAPKKRLSVVERIPSLQHTPTKIPHYSSLRTNLETFQTLFKIETMNKNTFTSFSSSVIPQKDSKKDIPLLKKIDEQEKKVDNDLVEEKDQAKPPLNQELNRTQTRTSNIHSTTSGYEQESLEQKKFTPKKSLYTSFMENSKLFESFDQILTHEDSLQSLESQLDIEIVDDESTDFGLDQSKKDKFSENFESDTLSEAENHFENENENQFENENEKDLDSTVELENFVQSFQAINSNLEQNTKTPSFENILVDPILLNDFGVFVERNFKDEVGLSLEFYEETFTYLKQEDSNEASSQAQIIMQRFIDEKSEEQIILSDISREEILISFDSVPKHPDRNLFENALNETTSILRDAFEQFVKTATFRTGLKKGNYQFPNLDYQRKLTMKKLNSKFF